MIVTFGTDRIHGGTGPRLASWDCGRHIDARKRKGLYTFRVKAKDNGEPGADTDHFDIKIWNSTDTDDDPYHKAKNTIAGGDIEIHTN